MADLDRGAYVANLAKATTEDEKKAITADFNLQETKLRRRSLGNIKFIGELYRIQMLNGRIMHEIIQKLLTTVDEESLECMCRLITTVGRLQDQETQRVLSSAKVLAGYSSLDVYFTSHQVSGLGRSALHCFTPQVPHREASLHGQDPLPHAGLVILGPFLSNPDPDHWQ